VGGSAGVAARSAGVAARSAGVAGHGAGVAGGGADSSGALLALSPRFFFSVANTSKMSCENS